MAADIHACSASRAYSIAIVCPSISISPAFLPNGTVGTAYNQTLTASGGMSPYTWSLSLGTLPAGLTLSAGGVISGTPTAAGTASFKVRVTDSAGCTASKSYSLTIVCPTISITPTSLPNGTVGVAYNQTLSAGGGVGPFTWTLQSGALPAGLSLSSGGVISGTPTTAETADFTVQATDSAGCSGTQALQITIAGPQTCILLGDLNGDGFVNGLDIQPFVDCLTTGSTSLGNCACGGFSGDRIVDMADMPLFINALLGV